MTLTIVDQITSFKGSFSFLSNMAGAETGEPELRLKMGGTVYPSVEHLYQAAKTEDSAAREQIAKAASPYAAKQLGKAPARGGVVVLRDGWTEMRLTVMRAALKQKFAHRAYAELLLATGDAELVEGNVWGDTFWGVCRGRGMNWLGKLLMEVRAELREK
ncbi:NADAR family protein [Deinococcus saxicola]|uniref:NADAR family protein n=1 Tax=Deinococcus saxicola TaxID=249406 RepID=UPI0039F0D8EE